VYVRYLDVFLRMTEIDSEFMDMDASGEPVEPKQQTTGSATASRTYELPWVGNVAELVPKLPRDFCLPST
jgi:hypothetical protein